MEEEDAPVVVSGTAVQVKLTKPKQAVAGDEDEPEIIVPVFKQFRYQEDQVFKDQLIVRMMVELIESKRTSTCNVYALIVEFYHSQLRDQELNPRPKHWPADHYLSVSFFDSEQDWVGFFEASRLKGKSLACNPEAGLPNHLYHQAHLKMEKWKQIKSEILNHTHSHWVKMFPNGRMSSGQTDIMVYVERLRVTLFKLWCVEPTSKGSKVVYKVCGWGSDTHTHTHTHSHTHRTSQ
jgi:hypothetical protein